jgi:preprotein translocase subunit SecY
MVTALKVALLLIVITAMVWLSTLWRWQSAHINPSGEQLLLYLVLLPLVLTAGLLLALWLAKKIRETLEPPARPAAGKTAAVSPADRLSA